MIYFITNHPDTYRYYTETTPYNIEVLLDTNETFQLFKDWAAKKYLEDNTYICHDKEANGLDPWKSDILYDIFGDEDTQFVIHSPYCSAKKYYDYVVPRFTLIGHNIKYDIKLSMTKHNIDIKRVYDTMIAEQRIYMKSGLFFGLDHLMVRYLGDYPDQSDKSIRNEFIDVDVRKFITLPRHIYYAAGDVEKLEAIRNEQLKKIEQYNLDFLINDIEFPLISMIAKAEVTGWHFDKDKWMEIYDENVKARHELELKMDAEVRRLRDETYPPGHPKRMYMIGGKWDNNRKHNPIYDLFNHDGTTNVMNLFGEPMKVNTLVGSKAKAAKKIDANPNNINYSSEVQIIEIFGRLGEPLLTNDESLVVPSFTRSGKIDRTSHRFGTGESAFTVYLSMLPETRMKTFIDLLLEHRGLSTAINNFGANFLSKINPVSGKIHTVFRQARAVTGRMQSGGGRAEPDKYNAQNIPSKSDFAIRMRNCFIAPEGYLVGTHDYSGAELIIMCSLSQDMKLLNIAKEDIHSYVAQKCWRNIYKLRAYQGIAKHEEIRQKRGREFKDADMVNAINENIKLSKTFVVNKDTNGGKTRTAFKPMTFGTIYGMFASKAAKTLHITKEEGEVVIKTIKREFPDVFTMVENASISAKAQGYLVLNERTKSRAWFPTLIKLLKGEIDSKENFGLISKEMSEARNIRIQGTQADAIKEASVEMQRYIDEHKIDVTITQW